MSVPTCMWPSASEQRIVGLEARVALLTSTLDGFRHEAQRAINRRANPGGQQAGTPAWAGVSLSVCLSIVRDVDRALGDDR